MFKTKRGVSLGELGRLQIRLESRENLEKKGVLVAKLWEIWQRRWDISEKGRVTHDFVPSVRFTSENVWFEPGMFGLFLLMGGV